MCFFQQRNTIEHEIRYGNDKLQSSSMLTAVNPRLLVNVKIQIPLPIAATLSKEED